ncbi:MAG: hypothetical protein ACTHQQ_04695, partial [Solirubrobacteraceae bacterium]
NDLEGQASWGKAVPQFVTRAKLRSGGDEAGSAPLDMRDLHPWSAVTNPGQKSSHAESRVCRFLVVPFV